MNYNWLKLKRMTIWSVDEDLEWLEISYIAGGNAKRYNHIGKTVAIPYTAKHT